MGADTATYAHLVDTTRNWYNNKRIIVLNLWILLLLITSTTNAYSATTFNSLQSLPQWRTYFNPAAGRLNLLNIIHIIGSLAALPIFPYVADGLGRRTCIFIGALIMCVATAGQTAVTSLGMFIGARFFIGFGLIFSCSTAPMLVAEIAYPAYRAPLTTAYNSFWYSGAIIANWVTFSAAEIQTTWSWRLPSILQSLPFALQVALIWFGPESPRYLISKNRNTEALKTLAYYHADSNEDDPLVRFEYDQIKAAIHHEVAAQVGWKTLFATRGYLYRMKVFAFLAFSSPWHTYSFKYVLLTVNITNPKTQLLMSGMIQIWNFVWALLAASLVDKVGRRTLFFASTIGMTVFFALQTACSTSYDKNGHDAAAHAFIAFIFLFYSFFALAFPTLIISYSIEILPYSLRAKGLTIFGLATCLAFFFAEHVHPPFGLGPFYWNIIYVVLLGGQGVFIGYYIRETKNCTLEEAGTVFDGNGITVQQVSATRNSIHSTSEEGEKESQTFHELG